jgi:hypothetical protein
VANPLRSTHHSSLRSATEHKMSCALVSPQTCTVVISSGGVSFVWEDESKAVQGSTFFRPEVALTGSCGDRMAPVTSSS